MFDLLETIYYCFDEIAKKRHVFKVETIGDCYVAVTGIPTPRKDHAVQMAKVSFYPSRLGRALNQKETLLIMLNFFAVC